MPPDRILPRDMPITPNYSEVEIDPNISPVLGENSDGTRDETIVDINSYWTYVQISIELAELDTGEVDCNINSQV